MHTDTPPTTDGDDATEDSQTDEPPSRAELAARIEALETELAAVEEADDDRSAVIVATGGTLDQAYPPLILASTAAAFGYDVTVFHTFWGLEILHKDHSEDLKLSSVGNPNLSVPNAVAALPGMDRVTTELMSRQIDANGTATIPELIETSLEMGVELQACQMTMDLLDYDESEFYDGVTAGVGAATAVQRMADADIQLLV